MPRRDVTRLEGFSDAVFGFVLTLLVVSLEVPEDFPALKETLSGFLPFAATFAVVAWIWFAHYSFFQRFALQDNLTVFLNLVLLFVVLFFAYPLKFVLTRVVGGFTGVGMPASGSGMGLMTPLDGRLLMVAYSFGFVAVFAVLALLYWNAWRRRDELALGPLEAFDARAGIRAHALSVAIGVLSIVLALLVPVRLLWLPGVVYFLLGPVLGTNGFRNGRARRRLEISLAGGGVPRQDP